MAEAASQAERSNARLLTRLDHEVCDIRKMAQESKVPTITADGKDLVALAVATSLTRNRAWIMQGFDEALAEVRELKALQESLLWDMYVFPDV